MARIFGVAMPSVSDWKKDGIPSARMMYLQATRKKELAGIDLNAALSAPKKQATQGHKEAANGWPELSAQPKEGEVA